jgi:hypothetical protein
MHEKMSLSGIKPGVPRDPSTLDPAVRAAGEKGLADVQADLRKRSESVTDASKFFGPHEGVGTDYDNRALGVYMGTFGAITALFSSLWSQSHDLYVGSVCSASSTPINTTFMAA